MPLREPVGLVVGVVKTHLILVELEPQIKDMPVVILAPVELEAVVAAAQVKLVTLLLRAMKQPVEVAMVCHLL